MAKLEEVELDLDLELRMLREALFELAAEGER